jgi:hypothetical protein
MRPGLTRAASLSAPRSSLPIQFNENWLGFTLVASLNRTAKPVLLLQLETDVFGFTLAAISELIPEVCLLDQSDAHSKSSNKGWQGLFQEKAVESCACLCKTFK